MKTFTKLSNLATNLANNTSSANTSLMNQLISDQHRYLIQRFFDNERTYTTLTVGGDNIVLPTSPVVNDTSATLSVAWPNISCQQLVVFGDGEQRTVNFTQNSTTISWTSPLYGKKYALTAVISAGDTSATLSTAWADTTQSLTTYFSDGESKTVTFTNGSTTISWVGGLTGGVDAWVRTFSANTTIAPVGVQFYPIPPTISKIKNDTITIGQLVYTPAPVQSIQEWTLLNSLPYTSDIPNYFFIYQNQVGFWPIPSSSGNIITFNYKARVPELSIADYTTGSLSGITVNSNTITGSGTLWTSIAPANVDLTYMNLFLEIDPPKGEGIWYQIKQINSDTSLTLIQPIQNAPSATATSYTIGQLPVLQEDFQDTIVYGALMTYYTFINPDPQKFKQMSLLYEERLKMLENYAGSKSVNVDLGSSPIPNNPNLFIFAPPQS